MRPERVFVLVLSVLLLVPFVIACNAPVIYGSTYAVDRAASIEWTVDVLETAKCLAQEWGVCDGYDD